MQQEVQLRATTCAAHDNNAELPANRFGKRGVTGITSRRTGATGHRLPFAPLHPGKATMTLTPVDALIAQLRDSPLDFGAEISKLREDFDTVLAAVPVPGHIHFTDSTRGGVPVIESHTPETDSTRCLISLHGGAYAAGSAAGYRPLYGSLAEQAGVRGIGVDYRLAPEHPYPAAIDDVLAVYNDLLESGIEPGNIAFAGDSAGGGLAIAALVAIVEAGLPRPGCAVVFSPWVDLECGSDSMRNRADLDPSLSVAALEIRARDYLGSQDPLTSSANPLHADLSGLPPLHIQVGSAEILLDDATRLAARAGAAHVHTELEIWPHMMHVFQTFGFFLDEARTALDRAAVFIATHTSR